MYPRIMRIAFPSMLVLVGLVITASYWNDYQLYGHSSNMDYFRQLSFDRCFRAGILYPRWLPDTYFGYGSPMFHFYGPLPYYITEIFMLGGVGIVTAFKLTLVLTLILSGLFMYLFCRDFAGPMGSMVAGLAYMLAPYHMVDMVVRHAFGEHVAFMFIPLVAWGLTGMIKGQWRFRLPIGALAFAGLIFTHNVTAMLAFGAFALWWGILAVYTHSKKAMAIGVAVMVCGLLLAAFFWIPVMAEKDLTFSKEALTEGYFVYSDHFVYPSQLFDLSWGFGGSRKGIKNDHMSYQVGVPHFLFLLAAILFFMKGLYRKRKESVLIVYGVILFFGSVFFMMPVSNFVYKLLPILQFVQFPWRFLVFVAFAASILAVAIEFLAERIKYPYMMQGLVAAAACLVVLFYAPYTKPHFQIYHQPGDRYYNYPAKGVAEREHKKPFKHIYEFADIDYMRSRGELGTARDDYLPRTVLRKPNGPAEQEVMWSGSENAVVSWEHDGPVDLVARVETDEPGLLLFARFDFPGWRAWVNDEPAPIYVGKKTGTIWVEAPAGQSVVNVRFTTTPLRTATGMMSLATLLGLVGFFLIACMRSRRDKKIN